MQEITLIKLWFQYKKTLKPYVHMVPQLWSLGYLDGGCEQGQQNYVTETQQGIMLTKTMLRHRKGQLAQLCRPNYLGNWGRKIKNLKAYVALEKVWGLLGHLVKLSQNKK